MENQKKCQGCGKEAENLINYKMQMFCQKCYDEESDNTSGRNESGGYD